MPRHSDPDLSGEESHDVKDNYAGTVDIMAKMGLLTTLLLKYTKVEAGYKPLNLLLSSQFVYT